MDTGKPVVWGSIAFILIACLWVWTQRCISETNHWKDIAEDQHEIIINQDRKLKAYIVLSEEMINYIDNGPVNQYYQPKKRIESLTNPLFF